MLIDGSLLTRVRKKQPLIHHITNIVTVADCAAVTRNIGALPVMASAMEEVAEMAASSSALVLNFGTLLPSIVEAALEAASAAKKARVPVIFDPVGVGATAFRTKNAQLILRQIAPEIIKGNVAEICTLAGYGGRIKGVESIGGYQPYRAATCLAHQTGAVVVMTGEEDLVTGGGHRAAVKNGHPMMGRVVGTGCMATSLLGVFAAVEKDYFRAAVTALAVLGVAGELAAAKEETAPVGPLCYKLFLQEALYFLTESDLNQKAHVEFWKEE